ncbi:Uncharacterized GST-like protein yncG [Kosakonia radicincitans]|nr:Uncharacterized GST-like protein yncG [Kosakonia radicincitans]
MITVYGVPGWGSALSEVMLTLAEIPYRFVNVDGFDQPGARQEMLKKLNPLGQVPTLQLDDGSIMTESAAVALMILDQRPDLAPPVARRKGNNSGDYWYGWSPMFIPHLPTQITRNAGPATRRNNYRKTARHTASRSICGWRAS